VGQWCLAAHRDGCQEITTDSHPVTKPMVKIDTQMPRVIPLTEAVGKLLTRNQMLAKGRPSVTTPRPKNHLLYISWYINDYGRPWTSSNGNPRIGPVHGANSWCWRGTACDHGTEGFASRSRQLVVAF
jgi:hypothetical protein